MWKIFDALESKNQYNYCTQSTHILHRAYSNTTVKTSERFIDTSYHALPIVTHTCKSKDRSGAMSEKHNSSGTSWLLSSEFLRVMPSPVNTKGCTFMTKLKITGKRRDAIFHNQRRECLLQYQGRDLACVP